MTATAVAPRSGSVDAPRAAAVVVAGGCALLLLRPVLASHVSHPTAALVGLFVALAAVSLAWPAASRRSYGGPPWLVLGAGVGAFAVGRVFSSGRPPTHALGVAVAANTLAAVAEEAFFRRFVFGLLEPYGAGVAIAGSAALFAAVHVTVYGVWVLPIDLAAGALLSWQRWATGSWVVPAVTHAVANILVVV
jgi:membrane protease YdiL (CAAX protease family)